jgi:hypothetical protein
MRIAGLIVVLLASDIAGAQATQAACKRSITFAVATNGTLVYRLPNVSPKWFDNAQKKFQRLCFAQHGAVPSGVEQYLIVLSTQSSAFNGLYPVYQTKVSTTSGRPMSGNGTVTDSQGSTWNYSYQGNSSSTTTTTEQANLPYTDTTVGLYATAYNENGTPIASARRTETSRQGGDAANTLGYNIGARLSSIHIKEHLLDEIVGRVNAVPLELVAHPSRTERPSSATPAPEAAIYESTGTDNGRFWTNAATGVNNLYTFANGRSIPLVHPDDTASSAVIKCIADPKSSACFDNWTESQKSFAWVLELGSAIRAARLTRDDLLGSVADDLNPTWTAIRDIYCQQSPGASYTDLDGGIASCSTGIVAK